MQWTRLVTAPVAIASLLLTGCGGSERTFPTGEWVSTGDPSGVLVMDFRSDGTWTGSSGATVDDAVQYDSGTYERDRDTITFTRDNVCEQREATIGTYEWELDDDQLTLTAQDDECQERVDALDGTTFTRAES